ncbi:transposase [Salicibibacter cibarius]|uniref:transposase n=1 Tax=Salicibibacter cibarius TaxID=2743000 RepID=UPI003CCE394B
MVDYRTGSHSVYDIKYHIVWATKYRYHVLRGEIAHRTRELIRQCCRVSVGNFSWLSAKGLLAGFSRNSGLSAVKGTYRL